MAQYLKISEFARLCGIPRKTLIFYDEIGLLKPDHVLDNGYRCYSIRQLDPASVISLLRELGMPLADIKHYLDRREPRALVALLTGQKEILARKLDRLGRIEALLDARLAMTRQALEAGTGVMELRDCPAEPLFVSSPVDCSSAESAEQAAYDFYDACDRAGMTYGYPLGYIVPRDRLEGDGPKWPGRFFFQYPPAELRGAGVEKPAGLYLICRERAYYDAPRAGYGPMLRYMREEGYEPAGDAYEEYLLDEIAVKAPADFLLQISIPVRPAEASLSPPPVV